MKLELLSFSPWKRFGCVFCATLQVGAPAASARVSADPEPSLELIPLQFMLWPRIHASSQPHLLSSRLLFQCRLAVSSLHMMDSPDLQFHYGLQIFTLFDLSRDSVGLPMHILCDQ